MCCLNRKRITYYRDKDWRAPRDLTIPMQLQYPSQIVFPATSCTSIPNCQTTTQAYMPFQPTYQASYPPIMVAPSQSLPMLPAPAAAGAIVPFSSLTPPVPCGQPPAPMQGAAMCQPYGMAQTTGMIQTTGLMQTPTMMPPYMTTQPSPAVGPFSMASVFEAQNWHGPYNPYSASMQRPF